jgi:hypothetical protein
MVSNELPVEEGMLELADDATQGNSLGSVQLSSLIVSRSETKAVH